MPIKLSFDPPFAKVSFPSRPARVPSSVLKPRASYDGSMFDIATSSDLSAMDLLALMNGRGFQALPVIGQSLSPACMAELSENGEIFDSEDDDDLPSLSQIQDPPKQVIDFTGDDDGDCEDDDTDHTEVS
jgi:hypothetical protein